MIQKSRFRFNLLALSPVRFIVMSAAFPVVLQAVVLGGLLWLALNGLGIGAGTGSADLMTLRKTNLTTLAVWGLWWPAMIAVALAFGRAWCTVCPMELVNRAGDAIARGTGLPRAGLGKFLRAGWVIVLVYLVLQLAVAGFSIHRVPHYTSIFLFTLVAIALLAGLIFREPRSFCRSFCPAGALLSVYGRYTPLQLEARSLAVCDDCRTKDCVSPSNRNRFDKRSCPSRLTPFSRSASDGCVLCLQCAKVCPHQNMGIGWVAPDAPVRRKTLLQPYEAVFVMVALGFVSHEVIGEVKWLDAFFHAVPKWLNGFVPAVAFGWFEALWFLVLFPLLVWGLITGAGYLMGHRSGLKPLLLAAATGAAPVVAVAHLAKAAAKVASWGGFLPLALRDPQGIDTFNRLADQTLAAPGGLAGLSLVGWGMLALIIFMAWKALRWSRQIPLESAVAARAGLAVASLLFSAVLSAWAWTA